MMMVMLIKLAEKYTNEMHKVDVTQNDILDIIRPLRMMMMSARCMLLCYMMLVISLI